MFAIRLSGQESKAFLKSFKKDKLVTSSFKQTLFYTFYFHVQIHFT